MLGTLKTRKHVSRSCSPLPPEYVVLRGGNCVSDITLVVHINFLPEYIHLLETYPEALDKRKLILWSMRLEMTYI